MSDSAKTDDIRKAALEKHLPFGDCEYCDENATSFLAGWDAANSEERLRWQIDQESFQNTTNKLAKRDEEVKRLREALNEIDNVTADTFSTTAPAARASAAIGVVRKILERLSLKDEGGK